MKISLNNRHKAGLFLTTVVAGLCLILGETVRETIGAIIIGFALTWAFGSASRVLRYSIGGLGVLLFLVPLIAGLIDHHHAMQSYELNLGIFHAQLPQFAKEHPDITAGIIHVPHGYTLDPPAPVHNPLTDKWNRFAENAPTHSGSVPKRPTEWDANGNSIPADSASTTKRYSDLPPGAKVIYAPSQGNWLAENAPTHSGTGTKAQTSGNPYAAYGGSVAKQPTEWDANGNPIPVDYAALADQARNSAPGPITNKHGGVILDMSKAQPINRILAVPNAGDLSFPRTMSAKDIAKALRADPGKNRAPDWYLEALDADVSLDDINQLTPPLDKPKAFDLNRVISDGAVIEVPSAMLAILFFGSIIAEGKRFAGRSNRPVES